jgi:hypothetical protein
MTHAGTTAAVRRVKPTAARGRLLIAEITALRLKEASIPRIQTSDRGRLFRRATLAEPVEKVDRKLDRLAR